MMPQGHSPSSFNIPTSDKRILPRLPHFSDIETSSLCLDILENEGQQVGEKPKNAATEMDIFSVRGLSDTQIKALILKKTGIDITSKEGREKISDIHTRAVEFYETEFYRVPSKEMKEYKMTSQKNIIDFIKKTTTDSTRRQTACNIIKIMFSIASFDSAENLHELDEKSISAIQDLFLPHIQVLDNSGFPKDSRQTKARITLDLHEGHKVIDFKLRFRPKASNSSIMKMIYNPEYGKAELIGDSIGIEYDCKNAEDIILLQSYFDETIYNRFGRDIHYTDKHIASELKNIGDILQVSGNNFQDRMKKREEHKKSFSGKGYRDFKANLKLPAAENPHHTKSQKKYTGFEIRGVLVDNRNNSGLSDWRIFEQSKKIHGMARLQGYVTEAYVKKVINNFYNKYPKAKFSKEKLLEKYLGDLKKIYFGKKKTVYYTTPERYSTLSASADLYPEGIIPGKD